MHNDTVSLLHMRHVIVAWTSGSKPIHVDSVAPCLFIFYIIVIHPWYPHAMHKRITHSITSSYLVKWGKMANGVGYSSLRLIPITPRAGVVWES